MKWRKGLKLHINKSLYFLQVEVFILPFCSMSINVPLPLRYGTPAPPTSVRKPSRVTMALYWHCVSRGNKMHTCTNNTFCDHNVHLKLGMTGLPPDHDSISFFFVSIETSYTVALQTAPSSWVTFISLLPPLRANLHSFNCEHLYKLCFSLSVVCCCCVGVGHPDPAESQYYPCPWQPCMHTGLLPQHVVQRLTQGH